MKKILSLIVAVTIVFALAGCKTNDSDNETLSSKETLATLSYLSGGFLDSDPTENMSGDFTLSSEEFAQLTTTEEDDETEIEEEIDQVNVYMHRLKTFMNNGTDSFGSAVEQESDNELYEFMLTFTIDEEEYVIYYNVDEEGTITGILLIGEVEYTIEAVNTLEDKLQLGDGEGEEEQEEESDTEHKMVLIATNGDDSIEVTYKVEEEGAETKFNMVKNINGVQTTAFLKISNEDNEHKIVVRENENEYAFKREQEEEGMVYKLQYQVNGVEGEVRITETTDEEGQVMYQYRIKEGNKEVDVERGKPSSRGKAKEKQV